MSSEEEALVIFQGPDSYISPSWYPSKHNHGKAVPTWDYVVVHARRMPEIKDDKSWLLNHVSELTDTHESNEHAKAISVNAALFPGARLQILIGSSC